MSASIERTRDVRMGADVEMPPDLIERIVSQLPEGLRSGGDAAFLGQTLFNIIVAERDESRFLAEQLQHALLITANPPKARGCEFAVAYLSSDDHLTVGGDFYDIVQLDEERCAFVVGDASGKGLPAALRTVEIKYAARAYTREHLVPEQMLERSNQYVCQAHGRDKSAPSTFTTMIACLYDHRSSTLRYASAAGEPPYLVRADGGAEEFPPLNMALGINCDEEFAGETYLVSPGDTLICFTDGITEARTDGKFFGSTILPQWVKTNVVGSDPKTIAENLLRESRAYASQRVLDDSCVLVARFT